MTSQFGGHAGRDVDVRQLGGIDVNLGAGNTATGTLRTVNASDDGNLVAIKTAAQLIDDGIGATGAAVPAKGMVACGTDGTNARALKTDAAGELQIDVASSALPTGAATLAEQQTQTTALGTINTSVGTVNTSVGTVNTTLGSPAQAGEVAAAIPDPATATLQGTLNTSLGTINTTLGTPAQAGEIATAIPDPSTATLQGTINTSIGTVNTSLGTINTTLGTPAQAGEIATEFAALSRNAGQPDGTTIRVTNAYGEIVEAPGVVAADFNGATLDLRPFSLGRFWGRCTVFGGTNHTLRLQVSIDGTTWINGTSTPVTINATGVFTGNIATADAGYRYVRAIIQYAVAACTYDLLGVTAKA